MLVSHPILPEHSEKLKSSGFMHPNGFSHTVPMPAVGQQPTARNIEDVGAYSAGNSCFIPGRIHNDSSGMNMYPSQPSGSSLGSPDSYGFSTGSTGSATGMLGPHYNIEMEHANHLSHVGEGCDMKTGVGDMWNNGYAQHLPSHYPCSNAFGPQYHCDRYYGMDINDGVRRKNATRESTNTLKNWLQEHKKNPYPTKGEKIMLAIVTKMTLTQVSTWFANARRRLKKENKMTWVPKNRSNDANNAGGKKVDDDDETGSQHSQGQKTDGGSDDGCDDADEAEVTSTNDNDVTSTSQAHDSKSNSTAKDESEENSSHKNEEDNKTSSSLKSEASENGKSFWIPSKGPGETNTNPSSSIPQSFHSEGKYNASSMNIQRQSSMLGHVDSTRLTNNCNYSPNWSASGYQDAMTSKTVSSSQVKTETPLKEMDMLSHRSSRMTDTKPFASNPIFPINKPQECIPDARSSIIASSYLPGFPDQTQPARNYRFSDQLGLPQTGGMNLSYYSQQDKNLRPNVTVSSPNLSSCSFNLENLSSKIGTASGIATKSSIPSQQKYQFHQHSRYSNGTGIPHYQSSYSAKRPTNNFTDMPYQTPQYQQKAAF